MNTSDTVSLGTYEHFSISTEVSHICLFYLQPIRIHQPIHLFHESSGRNSRIPPRNSDSPVKLCVIVLDYGAIACEQHFTPLQAVTRRLGIKQIDQRHLHSRRDAEEYEQILM
ncbi:hypothetical protein PMIN07_007132 [Paraphaeosphaeria minitans]